MQITLLSLFIKADGGMQIKYIKEFLTACKNFLEGTPKLDRHCIIQDWVDGTIDVDHSSTEEEKPQIHVLPLGKGIIHYHYPIGHPSYHEHCHNNRQHSNNLQYKQNKLDSGFFMLNFNYE